MGWFETEAFPDCLIGDDALDLTGAYLDELLAAYLDGVERKPTLAEFEATLVTVIGRVGGRWFSELDGQQLVKLAAKTKKAAKRQACAVGDIFAIPLRAGDFAFGRYIHDEPKSGGLIEVFAGVRPRPVLDAELLASGRMGTPLFVSGSATIENGDFPVLRREPDFRPEGLDALEFLDGSPSNGYSVVRFDRRVIRPFEGDYEQLKQWGDRTLNMIRTSDNVIEAVERWLGRLGSV